jgi:Tfp pilus assembly protein PilP
MKLTTGIILGMIAVGSAFAQSPSIVQSTGNKLQTVQQKKPVASGTMRGAPHAQTPAPASHASGKPAVAAARGKQPPAKTAPQVKNIASVGHASQRKGTPAPVAKKKSVRPRRALKAAVQHHGKVAVEVAKTAPAKTEKSDKNQTPEVSLTGRRDPFISPVVAQSAGGSGCSTGKRCLAIDQISLKGIVKSDNGMIAVVVNALDKAYFLHENDPVFNGYVVRITEDSIVFKETIQDKLGKAFTREVTKRIITPAV